MLLTDSHMGPSSYAFRGIPDLLMSIDLYEVRPRKDHRGVDLISDTLPSVGFGYHELLSLLTFMICLRAGRRERGAHMSTTSTATNPRTWP